MSELILYNTRTRMKEVFKPLQPSHVRVYTCGPTVYAPQHVGNMRSQLFADLLKRALLAEGWRVTHVINITDVGHLTDDADAGEDKIEAAAARTGRSAAAIAAEFTNQWLEDRSRLGCLAPEVLCKATEHIEEQVDLVRKLEAGGYTYRIADGIYFDTARFPDYAEFAHLQLDAQEGGARIGDVEGKRQAADFALWKFPPADGPRRQQEWESPWGRGFPGWHLECSAMAVRYLGETFDIHTGGVDHISVHHTNEIAQSECALGVHPWVNVWMHGEFLDLSGEKMSKSRGHTLTVEDLVSRGLPARAFRYFFLQAHYRQQQTYTDEAMESAATGYDRLLRLATELRYAGGEAGEKILEPYRERFRDAIRDDLNAPRALAVVWDVVRGEELTRPERWALLQEFDEVLGLDLGEATPRSEVQGRDPRIDALVADRERARKDKAFEEADRIRDVLSAEGVTVEDTPAGPRWRRT